MFDEPTLQILDQYHPLVRHIAKQACYSSSTIDINDLYQVGDMAVLRAVKAYDPSSGRNIKSFVANSIRNAIFNEAARFLGVLTVDFRTTSQASYASKLYEKGNTDEQIAVALTERYGRNFEVDHARDLRLIYNRRQYSQVQEDMTIEDLENGATIKDILDSVVRDNVDRVLIDKRIMGTSSVEQVASELHLTKKVIYDRELNLKERIKIAIEESA